MKEKNSIRITVQVKPRASRNRVEGWEDDVLVVRLTSPPVEGAANSALVKLLAKKLGIARGRLEIVAGKRSRSKIVQIDGITQDRLREVFH
ncbi:MAG: DUF167 domain-containing protein [bacterium]